MAEFPNLFRPLKVNRYSYKNRIVTAPMGFPLTFQDKQLGTAYYQKVEKWAKGGAAAVIVGETDVNFAEAERVSFKPVDYTLYSGSDFEGFKRYSDIIHNYGALALIELCHPGQEKPLLSPVVSQRGPYQDFRANKTPSGQTLPRGPISCIRPDGVPVEAMDVKMMQQVCLDFADVAAFMQAAGFDGILTHSGHGFLFTQFLSPRTNQRTDRYGGSLENRARFPLAIFRSLRERVGPDFIIEARLSGREGVPGGLEVEEVGRFCRMIEGLVDSVHISTGLYTNPVVTHLFSSMFVEHGCNSALSAAVKKYTSMPVGVIGGINSPALAEKIIAEGKADYVVLGRQMIADPDFPNKAGLGRADEIRACLRCYTCMPGSPHVYDTGKMIRGRCSINPTANPPIPLDKLPMPAGQRKVLIAGGGAAGLQAAITASDRGHSVTLVEKNSRLGGILNFTDFDFYKHDLRNFKNLLIREVLRRPVNVILNQTITPESLKSIQPEVIILAIGASPLLPAIPGIYSARHATAVYLPGSLIGKNVTIVGGGLVGCETALHLARCGHPVTIVESLDRLANEASGMAREALLLEIDRLNVKAKTRTRCTGITSSGICTENLEGESEYIPSDATFYALGMQPNRTDELRQSAGGIKVFEVGDCVRSGKVIEAVESGFTAAMQIV